MLLSFLFLFCFFIYKLFTQPDKVKAKLVFLQKWDGLVKPNDPFYGTLSKQIEKKSCQNKPPEVSPTL